ncbi:MAG: MFS transporter [Candidatus Pacearchaeota archaeon]
MFKKYFDKLDEKKKKAFVLILLFGLVSLLGDIIYEGARSVNGPYLNTIGANAVIVGLIIGLGELLGYAIRLFSGYFSDKARAHWFFTILGYGLLMAVPMLALSNYWQLAAVFILLERIGKGLRSPARDTLVSHATKQVGTGFGFGISEFIDQIGATIGPLIFTLFFIYFGNSQKTVADYQLGYSLLWIPFLILMTVLFFTFLKFRTPSKLEEKTNKRENSKISKVFWLYSTFTFITTIGFVNFAIIGYHLKTKGIVPDAQIPLLYTIAMIVDAVFGIIIGKKYDSLKIKYKNEKAGLFILLILPILTSIILPLIFSYNLIMIFLGVFCWGIVMGSHETIMKAAIADLTSVKKRGTGYGIFNGMYGLALFIGSVFAGYLYELSISLMIFILILTQVTSIAIFFALKKEIKKSNKI